MLKKILIFALTGILSLATFSSCGQKSADIILVTDSVGIKDNSFYTNIYSGITKFTAERGISKAVVSGEDEKTDALALIDKAVENGAKIIVCAGNNYVEALNTAQSKYSDVNFILVDALPISQETMAQNTASVVFEEHQAGFLAGYAAVKEGYTSLGFIGGKIAAPVQRYGYGFLQGIEYAAKELGLAASSISVKYAYSDGYTPNDEVKNEATSWFNSGTQVIFACGGQMNESVFKAAEEKGAVCIGSGIDQSVVSETVITSATKSLDKAVYNILKQYYEGKFPGGQNIVLGAKDNSIGLAMDNSKMKKFTIENYNEITAKITADIDMIASNIVKEQRADGTLVQISDLGLTTATVEVKEIKSETK